MIVIEQMDIVKLLFAVMIGGLIGFEREMHSKAAGLRTITLITVGAALFTMISLKFAESDRVAANIVTGIGFLGAGAILLSEGKIKGLTTASSIWVAAALGMAVGLGEFGLAGVAAAIVFIILWLFARLDALIDALGRDIRTYEIIYTPAPNKFEQIEDMIRLSGLKIIRKRRLKIEEDLLQGEWELRGAVARHNKFTDLMLADSDIIELKY